MRQLVEESLTPVYVGPRRRKVSANERRDHTIYLPTAQPIDGRYIGNSVFSSIRPLSQRQFSPSDSSYRTTLPMVIWDSETFLVLAFGVSERASARFRKPPPRPGNIACDRRRFSSLFRWSSHFMQKGKPRSKLIAAIVPSLVKISVTQSKKVERVEGPGRRAESNAD